MFTPGKMNAHIPANVEEKKIPSEDIELVCQSQYRADCKAISTSLPPAPSIVPQDVEVAGFTTSIVEAPLTQAPLANNPPNEEVDKMA